MNNQELSNNKKTLNSVLKMQPRASKGNNLIELGLRHGLAGKSPQFPEYLHYYMAWSSGYREYLLGDSTTPVA